MLPLPIRLPWANEFALAFVAISNQLSNGSNQWINGFIIDSISSLFKLIKQLTGCCLNKRKTRTAYNYTTHQLRWQSIEV